MLKPWITKDILKKCERRDGLLSDMRGESDPVKRDELRREYRVLRNRVTEEKRQGKKAHYALLFEKSKSKARDIWKGIRSLVNIRAPKTSSIKLMGDGGDLISDPTKISNIFNDHFFNFCLSSI